MARTITALAVAVALTGCGAMGSIAKNGQRTPPREQSADEAVAESNNDFNGFGIIYAVGLVGLLAVAIAVAHDGPEKDPRCTDRTYCP